MDLGYDVIVTLTGIVLVFLILVLLMLIIMLEGRIFKAIDEKKNPPRAKASAPAPKAAKPEVKAAQAQPAQQPVPEVQQGIPGEVVAAIAAAIYAMGNGKYQLRAVRRADRSNWGKAGVSDTTAPF